jgi:hypothetical protein
LAPNVMLPLLNFQIFKSVQQIGSVARRGHLMTLVRQRSCQANNDGKF